MRGKANILTHQEFKRVESMIIHNKHYQRNLAMLYLSFQAGLRACEIRQLTIGDFLSSDGSLKEMITLTKTKGNKTRNIYLSNKKFKDIMKSHIENYLKYMELKRIPFNINHPLFRSQKGGFFHNVQIVLLFRKFYKDAGIDGARSHSGRRTLITNLIDSGHDLKAIADMMGHENINTTIGYHQKNDNRLMKISERGVFD